MLAQSIWGQRRALRYPHPDLLGEVLAFGADGVPDDPVAVASSPARALAHLRRDPRRDAVKESPAGPQERDPAFEFCLAHRPRLGRRGREGDAPEVGRTGSDLVLHDLQGPGGVKLACHPGESCDRPVALAIGLERLQGELGALGAPTPPWPVEAEGHRPLPLGAAFDDGADGHGAVLHGGNSRLWPTPARHAAARASGPPAPPPAPSSGSQPRPPASRRTRADSDTGLRPWRASSGRAGRR
jgi:hypothetical protein